jgi:hypothetical protein
MLFFVIKYEIYTTRVTGKSQKLIDTKQRMPPPLQLDEGPHAKLRDAAKDMRPESAREIVLKTILNPVLITLSVPCFSTREGKLVRQSCAPNQASPERR